MEALGVLKRWKVEEELVEGVQWTCFERPIIGARPLRKYRSLIGLMVSANRSLGKINKKIDISVRPLKFQDRNAFPAIPILNCGDYEL